MSHGEATVLPSKYSGGPHGLGDPDDKSLRKVEVEVLIPKKMREVVRDEMCTDEVSKFTECAKTNGILMVVKCRQENSTMKSCMTKWYNDEGFKERCKKEYLQERSNYRRTGVPVKQDKTRVANYV